MGGLSDRELIEELQRRFEEKDQAVFDLGMTTRKLEEVNRRLVESERMKGDFLSNIRNEVNNPLASILALAREIAAHEVPGSADCAQMGATILQEAFALDFQMRNIFCAAELEAGEARVAFAAVDAERLIAASVGAFGSQAAARGLRLRFTWADQRGATGLSCFGTDPEKLQLIVANLVSNALKFSEEAGAVDVDACRLEGELSVVVRDTGIGIDEEDQRVIFERFRQLEAGRSKAYGGHGLGLSIVKALVELLGGKIVISSARGRGSVFTVRLPEGAAAGEQGVSADAGNEFFFDGESF